MSMVLNVVIIDYEMGNLFSVKRACEHVGLQAVVTSDKSVVAKSDGIILPGVGAFGDAMDNLRRLDLIAAIKDFIESGKPFMGICLGMQLLLSESEEFGLHKGLDIIKGSVVKFPVTSDGDRKIKVPQVGWNKIFRPHFVQDCKWVSSPLNGIANNEFMYFVHSFHAVPEENGVVLSYTNYAGMDYASSVIRGNVFACQFHPEKSASEGLKIYKNWALMVEGGK